MTINERLFALLAERRVSQKEFAVSCGLNPRNVSSWQNRGTDPPANAICRIAEYFGVSVEWLLSGEDHPHSSYVNNGSVAGNLGPNTGAVIVRNGGERVLSAECAELVRVYESLDVRDRIRLLKCAFEISDGAGSSDPAGGDV